jgi:hypothetical protein
MTSLIEKEIFVLKFYARSCGLTSNLNHLFVFFGMQTAYEKGQRKKGNPASGPEGLRPGGNGEL